MTYADLPSPTRWRRVTVGARVTWAVGVVGCVLASGTAETREAAWTALREWRG